MPIEKNNNILKYFINTALMVCISKLAWPYINQNICLIYNSFQLIRPRTSLFVSLCRFSGFCFYLIFILRRTVLSRQANRKSLQLKLQSWQDPWNAAHPRSTPDGVQLCVSSPAQRQQGQLGGKKNKRQLDKVWSFSVQRTNRLTV